MSHRRRHYSPGQVLAGIGLFLGALLPAQTSWAAAGPTLLGWELQHYTFATLAGDVGALVTNPAGLAGTVGADLHLDATGDGNRLDEWAAGLVGGSWAMAYRHRDLTPADGFPEGKNVDSYVLGFGAGKPAFSIGASREVDKVDLPGKDATRWLIGVRSQPVSWLVLAGTVRDPQHPHFLDGTLTPVYTYGISFKAVQGPSTFALSIEGSHPDGRFHRTDLAYGLQAGFASGLRLGAVLYDPADGPTEFGFSIGTRFDRGRAAARARSVEGDRGYRAQATVDFYDQARREAEAKR